MPRRLKALFTHLALMLALGTVVAPPRQAHAVIGGLAAIGGMPEVGIPVMAIGGAGILSGVVSWQFINHPPQGVSPVGGFFILMGAIFAPIAGILMLDGHGSLDLTFNPLAATDGAQLGLTADEVAAYNHELPELNAARQDIEAQLRAQAQPDLKASSALWKQYADAFSPAAYRAAGKVSDDLLRRLQQVH